MTVADDAFYDRLRGAFSGLAIGDAVGAPFEGRRRVARDEVTAWMRGGTALRWTDDTHMALALARSLAQNRGEVDVEHLGETFAKAYAAEPWRGYGAGPPQIFALARRGVPYARAAASLFSGRGSFGNGAAMRVTPVALVAAPDVERTARLAAAQAFVTHIHPEAVDAAVFVATAVCRLASPPIISTAVPANSPTILEALHDSCEVIGPGAVRDALGLVLDGAGAGRDPRGTARKLGCGVAARESVPAAVAALLVGDDIEEVLIEAVSLGGDTDTIAAIAGAMAGAVHGHRDIPDRLLGRLEASDEIERMSTQLLSLR